MAGSQRRSDNSTRFSRSLRKERSASPDKTRLSDVTRKGTRFKICQVSIKFQTYAAPLGS